MDPSLLKAATHGSVESLRQLLATDPKLLSSMTPHENTALHIAASLGRTEFAEEVLAFKEELLVRKNVDGDTPLHVAAKAGKLEVAKLLIDRTLTWPEDLNDTELKGPLVTKNNEGNTPLHEAVRHRKCDVALLLLDADPSRGHAVNNRMESPLDIAAREGLIIVVQKIADQPWVEERAPVPSTSSGTALHQAVLGGHIKIMEILLDKKSELIKLTDLDGNSALHYAAQKNKARMVSMLLNKNSSLAYEPNYQLQSPLHVAARYGSTDAIKELLKQCPDVAEMVDAAGRNAFHTAIASGKVNALKSLLRYVQPEEIVNRVDKDGNTPLHLAAKHAHIQCALLMLKDKRVSPCILNKEGHTARSTIEKSQDMSAYEMYLWKELKKQESIKCKNQPLPPVATYRAVRRKSSNREYFELSVETYTLVATLIATVTFAAMFTMPGGYNQQDGTAIHGHRTAFKMFVVSNTIAMCSSIVVVFCFIWAWRDPVKFKLDQLMWGHRLTVVACLAMVVSLMTAVHLTVVPASRWLAYVVIAIGGCTPIVVILILGKEVLFVPL